MKRQLFSLAVCLLLFAGLFSISVEPAKSASGDGIVEINLNIYGPFLRAMDDWPYSGPGTYQKDEELELEVGVHTDYHIEQPTIVDLQANGFLEGDTIIISWLGGLYPAGAWNPTNPDTTDYGLRANERIPLGGLLGLFSTSDQILDIDNLNRVLGAIDYSEDYVTPDTYWSNSRSDVASKLRAKGIEWYNGPMTTDIPEDFRISPYTGMEIKIPRNARFLFLSTIDSYYRDNLIGPEGLVVTIEKDTDVDGIPDHWEINGIDIDNDGTIDLDLPAMGADWEHKDVFVEIDYMPAFQPNQFALDLVIDAFENSPVTNPDMISGINLHLIVDEEIPYTEVLSGFDEFYNLKRSYFGTRDERGDGKTIEAKKKICRYCLSVDKIWPKPPNNRVPGIAEGLACDDFIVAYGAFNDYINTIENQAAIFMHELGHCLGLGHGGGDNVNYKPNYLSIMNYKFQYANYLPDRPLDYSRKALLTLDEKNLDERRGIGEATKTVWFEYNGDYPDGIWCRSAGNLAIDWCWDGNITAGVSRNLRLTPDEPFTERTTIVGYNDWENLVYRFRGVPLYLESATIDDYHVELTNDEIEEMFEEAKNIIEVSVPESYVPSNEVISFGLNEGDWFEYSVTWTGGEPESYYAVSFKGEVMSVTGEIIEIQWESENVGGQTSTSTETYNINLGSHDFWVIPADLEIGDTLVNEEWGTIDVDGEEYYGYAGSDRTVLWAVEDFATMHWDKETGLLVQHDCDYTGLHRRLLLERTNVWGTESSGFDPLFVIALALIVAGILLILLLLFRRKKKATHLPQ